MKKNLFLLGLGVFIFLFGCSEKSNDNQPIKSETKIIKYKMKKGGFEPSGVTKMGNDIYIVSDNGKIAIFKNNKVKYFKLKNKGDYEGITNDGKYLYIVSESRDSIKKFSKDLKFIKEYKIDRKFDGKKVLKKKGNGLEAITFLYEDEKGKHFIVANQSYKNKGKDKSALLFILIFDNKALTYKYIPMKVVDISGLYYDEDKDELYVLSDISDKVFVYKLKDMKLIKKFNVPGEEQEGIFKDTKYLYIADDKGKFFQIII